MPCSPGTGSWPGRGSPRSPYASSASTPPPVRSRTHSTAGFLDDAVHADLEAHEPTPEQRAQFAGTDLVISTGCLGYVTERTLKRVVEAQGTHRPWMAHFALRMFPFDPVEHALAELGYRTVHVEGVFKQRRFASPEEQTLVLDTMSSNGVDARGLEAEGWMYAQLHLSRPHRPSGPNDPNREQS